MFLHVQKPFSHFSEIQNNVWKKWNDVLKVVRTTLQLHANVRELNVAIDVTLTLRKIYLNLFCSSLKDSFSNVSRKNVKLFLKPFLNYMFWLFVFFLNAVRNNIHKNQMTFVKPFLLKLLNLRFTKKCT